MESSILSAPLSQASSPWLSPLLFFPYVPSFIPPSLHLQESNLWKGRKYTLYRSQALELPDLISLVDVADWGKSNCGWGLDLFFSVWSNPWHGMQPPTAKLLSPAGQGQFYRLPEWRDRISQSQIRPLLLACEPLQHLSKQVLYVLEENTGKKALAYLWRQNVLDRAPKDLDEMLQWFSLTLDSTFIRSTGQRVLQVNTTVVLLRSIIPKVPYLLPSIPITSLFKNNYVFGSH